jgi:hypothetical protein
MTVSIPPARTRASLGIEAARIGGGAALSMRNDPTELWSRALGFGFQERVATGVMYVYDGIGQLYGGTTLPFARGRGGCAWLVTETGVEDPGRRNSSLHNMVRMGFTALYQRQSWIWRPAGPGARVAV